MSKVCFSARSYERISKMTNQKETKIRRCPFCSATPIKIGDGLHPFEKTPYEQIRHPEPEDDVEWEDRCPLSILVFPLFKWNRISKNKRRIISNKG